MTETSNPDVNGKRLAEAVALAIYDALQLPDAAPIDLAEAAIAKVREFDAKGCTHLRSAGDPVCLWCGQVQP